MLIHVWIGLLFELEYFILGLGHMIGAENIINRNGLHPNELRDGMLGRVVARHGNLSLILGLTW